jgi:hypothetical protein
MLVAGIEGHVALAPDTQVLIFKDDYSIDVRGGNLFAEFSGQWFYIEECARELRVIAETFSRARA